MSAPNAPLPLMAPWVTAQASVKRKHLTPTWAQDEEAVVIMGVHSWSSLPIIGQVILYNGPLPSPKLLRVASTA